MTRERRRGVVARILAAAAAAVAVGGLAIVVAPSASAHDYLVDSSPKANSVQSLPISQVSLTFNDIVLDLSHNGSSSLVQITGPDGASKHFETGCPKIADRVVTTPVSLGAPGKYEVTWQIVSADGHVVSDSIAFTYRPPTGTKEAAGSASRPACGSGATTSSAIPAPQSTGTAQGVAKSGALTIVIVIAIVIVVLAIGAVVLIVLTSRRSRKKDATPPAEE